MSNTMDNHDFGTATPPTAVGQPPAAGDQVRTDLPPPSGAPSVQPGAPGGQITSVGRLFASGCLDALLMVVTLFIGWLIWGAITASNAQTPGKKLMGLQVVHAETGKPLSWAQMVLLRGLVGGIVMNIAGMLIIGLVLLFMPLWDARNQSVHGKISNSVVVEV